ncbi:MAG: c-type cytochrome [Acidimicrobiia bacterium]|nr:c-type cytochrome [Acidimicrobiia bacterium]
MSDLAAAAANIGGPEDLVMRSAKARAEATGTTVDAVLAAWAGGGATPATTAATPEPGSAPEAAGSVVETATPEPAPQAAPAASAPIPAPDDAPTRMVAAAPIPETVTIEESYEWDQVTTVRTAGIKERTRSVIPIWMLGLFTILPLFAVGYITVNSAGPDCGKAGQLAIDFRNELVNCDLSAYKGVGGGGGGQTDFIANGSATYVTCAACHGANGQGGAGPALSGGSVLTTFSSCSDHVTWVTLGSAGWQAQFGNTYGDISKPVAGGMQAWGESLSEEEIRSVVLYERVAFGGEPLDTAIADCGLAAAPADGTTTTDSTVPTGETPTTTAP